MCGKEDRKPDDIEITPEMIAAGEGIILGELGGSEEIASKDFVRELAVKVYRAMSSVRVERVPSPPSGQKRTTKRPSARNMQTRE